MRRPIGIKTIKRCNLNKYSIAMDYVLYAFLIAIYKRTYLYFPMYDGKMLKRYFESKRNDRDRYSK